MCSCVQDISLVIYCNMAIYCNTLEGNMQYGDDPYCFTPRAYPLARCLDHGADVVITGRCVDSALILAPLIHEVS